MYGGKGVGIFKMEGEGRIRDTIIFTLLLLFSNQKKTKKIETRNAHIEYAFTLTKIEDIYLIHQSLGKR